jgi:hypothetical protein
MSSFLLSFFTGSATHTANWLLVTEEDMNSFATVLDGAFWGGAISPFGLPCFLLAIGYGLRRVNLLFGVWVIAFPLTIWAMIFMSISDLSGLPRSLAGIISGVSFTLLMLMFGRIRFQKK